MSNCFVEVKSEPFHIEELENESIRVYRTRLLPGSETEFHRHSEDTIYIVLCGGLLLTQKIRSGHASPTFLADSLTFRRKIILAVKRFLNRGYIELEDGFFFSMPSRDFPIIHKARSSEKNMKPVVLLGIEVAKSKSIERIIEEEKSIYKKELEKDRYCVYRLSLRPGQSINDNKGYSGIIIAVKGSAAIHYKNRKIESGGYIWHEANERIGFHNYSLDKPFEAIVIALK